MSSTVVVPQSTQGDTKTDTYPTEWNSATHSRVMRTMGIIPRSPSEVNRKGALPAREFFASKRPASGTIQEAGLNIRGAWSTLHTLYDSYFNLTFNHPLRELQDADTKASTWQWETLTPGPDSYLYPPHLAVIPTSVAAPLVKPLWDPNHEAIFNTFRFSDTAAIIKGVIPLALLPEPFKGARTIRDIETATHEDRQKLLAEVYSVPNIGDRADWFTDRVWAQQMFTGTNPMIISIASQEWVQQFEAEAQAQQLDNVLQVMKDTDSKLYVADYSYFRKAASDPNGSNPIDPTATLSSEDPTKPPTTDVRYGCASVGLFNLTSTGQLHPLAICLDYKGALGQPSVTIFNKHPTPGIATTSDEANDWPWRYAKTCLSSADWVHHELRVHLTNTHFMEEVTIVACEQNFDDGHPIYTLLQPHWDKTLSLNAAARNTLVPDIICGISGFKDEWVFNYINNVYSDFDWVGNYVPNDLANRGFPLNSLTDKTDPDYARYHNYAYGKNMAILWPLLKKFVTAYLTAYPQFNTDEQIQTDPKIQAWCATMRSKLPSFPALNTRDSLIDALTMCIHLASPQHTAVNYLQAYYYCFVINRPPALYKPLPSSLSALNQYTETDLFDALPCNYPQDWLLASHLPWLLSYQVAGSQSLDNYAKTLMHIALQEPAVKAAASMLLTDMGTIATAFQENSQEMDDQNTPYMVMEPTATAVSILI